MHTFYLPIQLWNLSNGQQAVKIESSDNTETLTNVLDRLETEAPGVKIRISDGRRINASVSIRVNGRTKLNLKDAVEPNSEIAILLPT